MRLHTYINYINVLHNTLTHAHVLKHTHTNSRLRTVTKLFQVDLLISRSSSVHVQHADDSH